MTELNQIYKCNVCGNMVEMVHAAGGKLVCCSQSMELQTANSREASVEKHVPVVTTANPGIKVTVGSVLHPMEDKHYIEWIEVVTSTGVERRYLKPGEKPGAEFAGAGGSFEVRAYCNIHGLWHNN